MFDLKLTSYERMRRFLAGASGDLLTDNLNNKRDITSWISAISRNVQKYLRRDLEIGEYTEFFDLRYNSKEFWVENLPVNSITSVETDIEGRYDGSESEISSTDYHTGNHDNSVVIYVGQGYRAKKGIKIVYNGGLAVSGFISIFETGDASAWTINNFVIGGDSGAVGILRDSGADSVTVEVLYGVYDIGESLAQYSDENGDTVVGSAVTLISKTQECLAESHPEIVAGCEMEIRYYRKHKTDFENTGTQRDATTVRRDGTRKKRYPLQPEVMDKIDPYLRVELF